MARVDPIPYRPFRTITLAPPEMRSALVEIVRIVDARNGGEMDDSEAWYRIDDVIEALPEDVWREVLG